MKTKQDYENLLLNILNPLKSYFSEGKAYIDIGATSAHYSEHLKRIESFSRPLWGLAPYYSCKNEQKDYSFAEIYRNGFSNGTNPYSPEYWGKVSDYDQTIVEMAAMGLSLILAPDTFFYPLSEAEQNNFAQWLYTINFLKVPNNNWRLFAVLVNCGLKNVGKPYSDKTIESAVAEMDKWYLGDGWYSDGDVDRCDYYTAFAIHFYSLVYAKFIESTNKSRSDLLKERACEFAKSYMRFFTADGEAIPYGRSLIYRFAQVSFWSAFLWAGCSSVPIGVVKGIINRNLRYWLSAPIFDKSGILTIGYGFPNLLMSDDYNAPGSPYWAMKAFLFLALPENHQFYQSKEEPLPENDGVFFIKSTGMIVANSGFDAVLYPHGVFFDYDSCLMAEKYSKFAYSAKFGFCVPRSEYTINKKSPDSMLSFEVDGRIAVRYKTKSYEILDGNRIKTVWSPCRGIEVETVITPYKSSHKREHTVYAEYPCRAYDAGFAVPFINEKTSISSEGNKAAVLTGNIGCEISSELGKPIIINPEPNSNIVSTKTKIPAICYEIQPGKTKITSMVYEKVKNCT